MAENYGIKIAKQGFDVKTLLTELNKKNFNILSTEDTLIRKELSATPSTTNFFLGYILTPDEDWEYYFGSIKTISIANAGSGYSAYEYLDVVGGDSNGLIGISSVDGSGAVTDIFVSMGGSGYDVASGVTTTGGSGSGFTLNIDSVTEESSVRVNPLNLGNGSPTYVIYENLIP